MPAPIGGPPYHYDIQNAIPGIVKDAADAGKIIFHVVGDTSGIKNAGYRANAAKIMKGDLKKGNEEPSFFYHLGDEVYYHGEVGAY